MTRIDFLCLVPVIDVIIPAHNEALSIEKVILDIPSLVRHIIVTDNNSSDHTAENARMAGAVVLQETRKGYGYACLKAMAFIEQLEVPPDIVVFLDGDYSDFPEELEAVIAPIIEEKADLVVGARIKAWREPGSMTRTQVFGNWLASSLMKMLFKSPFTDLGPFRAIKYHQLVDLRMSDKTYGWTIEMQLKALKQNYNCCEVPVHYRNRIGTSKVSGTLRGAVSAGFKILWWILKYSVR